MNKSSERVENLVRLMTLEEKVSLLAGASMWTTNPVERLGIPAIKVTDGPNGARGDGLFGVGKSAACFPAGIGLAATWNPDLVTQVGQALGEEAHTKGAHVLLAPTVNIHRSPVNGRNFECYSEDPFLSARMAVAYIQGVQSRGVSATVKHFICNDSEFERNTISSEVGERALREIYLPPFEAAVKEAGSWCVMSSYNRINGTYACDHSDLLTSILKEELGFSGVVMSDWFGTKSTAAAANAGMDLEMPGPGMWRGQKLVEAVRSGAVKETVIDDAAARILTLIERVGAFDAPLPALEQSIDLPEHRAVARQAAAESIVLLKNRAGLLPLDPTRLKKVAVIGPNAKTAQIMGGGSAKVNSHYAITPYQGLMAQLGNDVEVGYELGCPNYKFTPCLDPDRVSPSQGSPDHGFRIEFFNSLDLSGDPVWETVVQVSEQVWIGPVGPGVNPQAFSARISGVFSTTEAGPLTFGLSSSGRCRLMVDGRELIDNWTHQTQGDSFMGMGSAEKVVELQRVGNPPVELVLEYSHQDAGPIAGARLGCAPVLPEHAIQRAAALAKAADVALVFVGLNGEWESEGHDRPDLELVGEQAALVAAVTAANPNTVVVVQTGSPLVMPWLDQAGAVLQAWFPGQECGNAIADVLLGKVDPSGRLPQTFPVRLEDNPAYINYPGENGKVVYGEGIFVGYRYYDKKKVTPLFPFGYGLSYTTFTTANLRLDRAELSPEDTLTATVDVTNTGSRSGVEVVQCYVRDLKSQVLRPEKELKGFAKVTLPPGETRPVSFKLCKKDLAFFDDAAGCWVAEAGEFEVLVGSSAQAIHAAAPFTLAATAAFGGRPRKPVRLTLDSTLKELLSNPAARTILDKNLPGFSNNPQAGEALGFSLRQLASFDAVLLNETVLQAIAAGLEKIDGAVA